MRRIAMIAGLACTLINLPSFAQTNDILASVQRLNIVNNPDEVGRWWVEIINTPEGKAALDIVTTYFGAPGAGTAAVEGIAAIVGPSKDASNEHWDTIKAPVDYTVCTASVRDPTVNCNGTFTGVLRTADHLQSGKIDGLHWYIVVPRPRIGEGRCFVDGVVTVTFVRASKKSQFPQCHAVNTNTPPEFHYGK